MIPAKNLAQQAAKQIAREPWEILEGAGQQIAGVEPLPHTESQSFEPVPDKARLQEQDKAQTVRRMEALDIELKEIERQRIFNELQRKIQEGQEVYLNDIAELSYEQKDVLKAQMETIKTQKANDKYASVKSLAEPAAKPSRRFAFGKGAKAQAQKEQTKTERPLPPSG